jgi:hypothetical protein
METSALEWRLLRFALLDYLAESCLDSAGSGKGRGGLAEVLPTVDGGMVGGWQWQGKGREGWDGGASATLHEMGGRQ